MVARVRKRNFHEQKEEMLLLLVLRFYFVVVSLTFTATNRITGLAHKSRERFLANLKCYTLANAESRVLAISEEYLPSKNCAVQSAYNMPGRQAKTRNK